MTILYRSLVQESDYYKSRKALYKTLLALEIGITAIEAELTSYLHKKTSETPEQYQERLKLFSYTPLLMTHLEELGDRLLASPLSVDTEAEWYPLWTKNTDGLGTPESAFLRKAILTSLIYGKVYFGVRLPSRLPESLADEANDLPIVKIYSPAQVIREGVTDDKPWYVTREIVELASPEALTHVERTTIWENGRTRVYEVPVEAISSLTIDATIEPKPYQYYPGVPTAMVTLETKAIGEHCYSKQLQHLRMENAWNYAAYIAGAIQRIYKPQVLPEDDPRKVYEVPDYSSYDFSGTDVLVGGGFEYVEAKGDALKNIQAAMDKVESQLKGLVHKSFASVSETAVEQSGVSKSIDQIALNDALRAYGLAFCQGYQKLLSLVSGLMATGEVKVSGMQDYSQDSVDELIDKTDKLLAFADILSPLCMQKWLERLQVAMHPGAPQDLLDEMAATIPEWSDTEDGTGATVEEIADMLGLTPEEVQAALGGQDA